MTASKCDLILHPDDRGWFVEAWLEASRERVPFAARLRLRRRGGGWRWMEFRGTPRFRRNGALAGYIGRLAGPPN